MEREVLQRRAGRDDLEERRVQVADGVTFAVEEAVQFGADEGLGELPCRVEILGEQEGGAGVAGGCG